MKFKLFGILAAMLITVFTLNAQQGQVQQKVPDLTVDFLVGDIIFVYQSLNTIEINGREADAFIQVKEHFKPYMEKWNAEQPKAEDKTTITLPVNIAQNMLAFLERAKFAGGNAERYVRVKDAIVAKAQEVQKQMQANGN